MTFVLCFSAAAEVFTAAMFPAELPVIVVGKVPFPGQVGAVFRFSIFSHISSFMF
jgi:hypothetical protein